MKSNKLFKTIALALAISSVGAITPTLKVSAAESGWIQRGSYWYYMDGTGRITTGWLKDNGRWYYFDASGVMKTGWIYDSGNWYYCYSNGQMATDTTIGGYYLGSSGAWTTSRSSNTSASSSSGDALAWKYINGTHHIRVDISSSQEDYVAADKMLNYNIEISDTDKRMLKTISGNLAQGRATLDEVKNDVIGKVVNGKYKITDVKFFDQSFKITTGTSPDEKIKAIKGSSLYDYNSSSSYKYDEFLVFSCGNARVGEWEAMRVCIELEAV